MAVVVFVSATSLTAMSFSWLWQSNKSRAAEVRKEAVVVYERIKNANYINRYYALDQLILFLEKNKNSNEVDLLFDKIIRNENALWELSCIFSPLSRDRVELSDELIPLIKKNYDVLSMSQHGATLLDALMNKDSKSVEELTLFAIENFDVLCVSAKNDDFFNIVIKHNPNVIEKFSNKIVGNVTALTKTLVGKKFVDEVMIHRSKDVAKERAFVLLSSSEQFSPKLLNNCAKTFEDDICIDELISKTHKDDDFSCLLKKFIYQEHCKECVKDNAIHGSTTIRNLRENIGSLVSMNTIDEYVVPNIGLSHMVMTALQTEEHNKDNYYTLYHGQSSKLGFQQRWFSWLNNPEGDSMLPVIYPMPETQEGRVKEDTDIMNYRRMIYFSGNRPPALYAVGPLFTNITMRLAVLNSAAGSIPSITIKETFEDAYRLGVYYHFKSQLEKLEKMYKKLHQKGQLVQFNIKKDKINDFVFLSGDGGETVFIEGIGETKDAGLVLDALRNNPEKIKTHGYSFGVAITSHLADPSSGIKCSIINSADPAEWAAYQQKEQALRADMLRFMQEKN